jgi:hypothetical protein
MQNKTTEVEHQLESRLCGYCDNISLAVHIDRYGDKWVTCGKEDCGFEAFLEPRTPNPEGARLGAQFIKDMEEQQ